MLSVLRKKENQSIFYGVLEKFIDIVVSMITGIVVIRLLSREDYGIISTVGSYAFIFSIINVAPENYLFKIYNNVKKINMNEYISSYLIFDIIDGILITALYAITGIILTISNRNSGFIVIAISSGLTLLINQIYNVSRIILELRYEQKVITRITTITRILKLLITLLLLLYPNLYVIAFREIFIALFQSILLYILIKKRLNLKIKKFDMKKVIIDVKESILKFSFMSHVTGVLTGLIYNIDPIILGWFTSINVVGTYSIALNSTNYFIYIFQVLQKNSMIALGNAENERDACTSISKLTYLSVILGIVQLIGFIFIGKYYMLLYVGKNEVDIVYTYAFWILLGLTVCNSLRPISSYLIIKYDIKKYFIYSVVPTFSFTMIIYIISSKYYGAIGIAMANFIAYSFWGISQIILLKKSKFKFYI